MNSDGNNIFSVWITVILTIVIGCAVVFFVVSVFKNIPVEILKREAIERNFAEYNSTNGVWQWKTNN